MSEKIKEMLEEMKEIGKNVLLNLATTERLEAKIDELFKSIHGIENPKATKPVATTEKPLVDKKSKKFDYEIDCIIKLETPKAFQVSYKDKLCWVPKSTVEDSENYAVDTEYQLLAIESWIYKKNWGEL